MVTNSNEMSNGANAGSRTRMTEGRQILSLAEPVQQNAKTNENGHASAPSCAPSGAVCNRDGDITVTSGRVQVVCPSCKRVFTARMRDVRRGRGKYCSYRCVGISKIARLRHGSGADNPNWKGGFSAYAHKLNFRAKFPEKAAAHDACKNALASGRLVRPDRCEDCGAICKPHGHHEDYAKPLDVVWLCRPCHSARHPRGGSH